MELLIFSWIFLCFLCAAVLVDKKTGFFGTFFLCLFLSPLLGVIIAVASGNRPRPLSETGKNQAAKRDLLNRIEELKKEEELGLISEKNQQKLNELIATYKNYDELIILNKKNELSRRKEIQSKQKKTFFLILLVLITVLASIYYLGDYLIMIRDYFYGV